MPHSGRIGGMPIFAGADPGITWTHVLFFLAVLVLGPVFLIWGIRLYIYAAKKEKEAEERD
jgi:hypothetical protein